MKTEHKSKNRRKIYMSILPSSHCSVPSFSPRTRARGDLPAATLFVLRMDSRRFIIGRGLSYDFRMQTIHGASLGMTVRKLSDEASLRMWIVSPSIGRWPAVSALLGGNWWLGTVNLACELRDTKIKVNSICPGFTATDLNGNTGTQTIEEGAIAIVRFAQQPDYSPTGGYFHKDGTCPW
jgi:hypothetical protein